MGCQEKKGFLGGIKASKDVKKNVPKPPSQLTASAGNMGVTLYWVASSDNGGSDITQHQYRKKEESGEYGDWIGIPASTTGQDHSTNYTVTGLSYKTTYTFQVRAINSTGGSAASNPTTATYMSVYIPDVNLRRVLENQLGKSEGDNITEEEMADSSFVYLTASNLGIRDLTGLEYATSLSFLYLENNSISDISPLSRLNELTIITLTDNEIVDISPLSGFTQLNILLLDYNNIVDISSLPADMTQMSTLRLRNNQIVDISPLVDSKRGFSGNHYRAVTLSGNPLNEVSLDTHISTLESNDVTVSYATHYVVKISGQKQQGIVNTALAEPFVVEVQDKDGNPLANVKVTLQIAIPRDGGGSLSSASPTNTLTPTYLSNGLIQADTRSDSNGRVAVTFTLGSVVGNQVVGIILPEAATLSFHSALFLATANPSN